MTKKVLRYLGRYYQILLAIGPKIVEADKISLAKFYHLSQLLPPKDIPVFVSALGSKAKYLITLDKRHFLDNNNLKISYPKIKITNPADFLKDFIAGVA